MLNYNLNYYVDFLKDQLTVYGLLETELSDDAWSKIVETAFQELLRYYDQTGFISVAAESCIDIRKVEEENNIRISSVSNVYSTSIDGMYYGNSMDYVQADPAWIGFWQTGYGSRVTDWTYNYMNYVNLNRIRQTVAGSDLDFREDTINRKLYINYSATHPYAITLEYVPRCQTVEDVRGDFWVDLLKRMSLAYAKIAIGRARTRFVQSGALWTDDGATMLQEGNAELQALRERLQSNSDYMYPVS